VDDAVDESRMMDRLHHRHERRSSAVLHRTSRIDGFAPITSGSCSLGRALDGVDGLVALPIEAGSLSRAENVRVPSRRCADGW
jgi:hypothetical protein